MARLDAARVGAWRGLQAVVGQIERGIDEELRADWDIPLGWFDVLASLQRLTRHNGSYFSLSSSNSTPLQRFIYFPHIL